jgi:hypothetical protein
VSAWLHEAGLPAARTTHHAQPLIIRDRPVTFWDFIENGGGSAALIDLAEVLRVLHQMSVPTVTLTPTTSSRPPTAPWC